MSHRGYSPGQSFGIRAAWLIVEALVLLNPICTSYRLKRRVLRRFGATVGRGVIIKPNVHVKYPWRLTVGDDVWLGERCWIDNLGDVVIENNACISQGAYLCTGNHDWSVETMDLDVRSIRVGAGAWVGAFARVGPGVTVASESIVCLGATLLQDTEPRGIYVGNPAQQRGTRKFADCDD
jgi:putative colanic acid biosynthesis acetyltransferase WcaF